MFDQPLPEDAEPPELLDGYARMLFERQDSIRRVFDELARPGALPAVIHCAAGKDRTGLIIALVLAMLHVPEETIVADFALSAECLGEEFLQEAQQWVARKGWLWERVGHLWGCPPDLIRWTLRQLDEVFGGVEAYLLGSGLTPGQLEHLRDALTTT